MLPPGAAVMIPVELRLAVVIADALIAPVVKLAVVALPVTSNVDVDDNAVAVTGPDTVPPALET